MKLELVFLIGKKGLKVRINQEKPIKDNLVLLGEIMMNCSSRNDKRIYEARKKHGNQY